MRKNEAKLNQIQREKGQQDRLIISQEQELELQEFQKEKMEVRKKLREVRRNLDKDIQDLGSNLKMINIGLIPYKKNTSTHPGHASYALSQQAP